MEKEFVPYNIAKQLKQLGFDEQCLGVYFEQQLDYSFPPYYCKPDNPWVLAPLWQQGFDWFETVHLLHSYIVYDFMAYDVIIYDVKRNNSCKIETLLSVPDAPKLFTIQEVRQACLEKLISIVSNPLQQQS